MDNWEAMIKMSEEPFNEQETYRSVRFFWLPAGYRLVVSGWQVWKRGAVYLHRLSEQE